MHLDTTELVGYLASALVVVSLAMTSVVRLRAISLVGSLAFVAYGVLIESIPIVVTNAAIAVLNVWFLRSELAAGARSPPSSYPSTRPTSSTSFGTTCPTSTASSPASSSAPSRARWRCC